MRVLAVALPLTLGLLLLLTNVVGDVVLLYLGNTQTSGAKSPLRFIDGAGYSATNAEGFVTVSFPTPQQTGFTAAVAGASGAYGTYLLDVLEVQAQLTTVTGWHLHLDVTQALSGSGINAAYLFYCTAAPTGVPDSGVPLTSGTDSAGDVWAVFPPTCAGAQSSLSLSATSSGSALALPSITSGSSVLYLSLAVDIASAGATTTTGAIVDLVASSP